MSWNRESAYRIDEEMGTFDPFKAAYEEDHELLVTYVDPSSHVHTFFESERDEAIGVDAGGDDRDSGRIQSGQGGPPLCCIRRGHDERAGPTDQGIQPGRLAKGRREMQMRHHPCASRRTDREADWYIPGIVNIDDRR